MAEGRRQRAARIADIARNRRDRKTKTYHGGTETREQRRVGESRVIAVIARDRKPKQRKSKPELVRVWSVFEPEWEQIDEVCHAGVTVFIPKMY